MRASAGGQDRSVRHRPRLSCTSTLGPAVPSPLRCWSRKAMTWSTKDSTGAAGLGAFAVRGLLPAAHVVELAEPGRLSLPAREVVEEVERGVRLGVGLQEALGQEERHALSRRVGGSRLRSAQNGSCGVVDLLQAQVDAVAVGLRRAVEVVLRGVVDRPGRGVDRPGRAAGWRPSSRSGRRCCRGSGSRRRPAPSRRRPRGPSAAWAMPIRPVHAS